MSATELAVVINYVVSLQQQVQQLQGRVESLEGKSTHTERELWSLQTGQTDLQTDYTKLRSDHDSLGYEVRFVLCQTLEDVADLKALVVEDSDYCDQLSLADWWQRHPEALESASVDRCCNNCLADRNT